MPRKTLVLLLLLGCSESPVEIEPEPTVTGSWSGSFVDDSFKRGADSRREAYEIELLQFSDQTVQVDGIVIRWYDEQVDTRSFISGDGIFPAPFLAITASSFWGVITLRGELVDGMLYLEKNGQNELILRRQ